MTNSPVQQISEHVIWMPPAAPDRPSLCWVAGHKRSVLLDAGSSPAHLHAFLSAVEPYDLPPLRSAVLSHWHWDHVFGASELNVPIIAHMLTTHRLSLMENWDWSDAALDARVATGEEIAFCADNIKLELPEPRRVRILLPDISFNRMLDLCLGDITVQVHHVGGDHSADCCVAYVPSDGVLFLSDCLYDAIYAPTRHYTREKLYPVLDQLLEFDANLYVEGHNRAVLKHDEFLSLVKALRLAGDLVAAMGKDEPAIFAAVLAETGAPPDDDMREFVRAFMAGLNG
ncbi:MAG: MBL fold metallo-hydrolase [Anaerolineae bacterium]